MSLSPLPMTVIGGYLGAGKTTLINRLLAEDHGLRLMIMVNDFGAINIDADLLQSAEEDTLTLSNGCVCCTMGADLFMAIGRALDRRPRPDHLVIEASGIADPARIAQAAIAEPELSYGGIVTVVDARNFPKLAEDDQIGPQIRGQVMEADLLVITKTDGKDPDLEHRLAGLGAARWVYASDPQNLVALLCSPADGEAPALAGLPHPGYVSWSTKAPTRLDRNRLERVLETRPAALYRLKGWVRDVVEDRGWQVQVVGRMVDIRACASPRETQLVGIALAGSLDRAGIEAWWAKATSEVEEVPT